jgi:hypothetical protein
MKSNKIFIKKLDAAIDGTVIKDGRLVMPVESCSVSAGMCTTPDGREAQIIITVTTDQSEWIEED